VVSRQAHATFKGFESKLIFPLMENHYGLIDLTAISRPNRVAGRK
jgi:iron complex outermembrane recepter protein